MEEKNFKWLVLACVVAICAAAAIDIFGCAAFQDQAEDQQVKLAACSTICAAAELTEPVCDKSKDGWEYLVAASEFSKCTTECVDDYFTILDHLNIMCLQEATLLAKKEQNRGAMCEMFEKCFK